MVTAKILVIVPAYNESESLPAVIQDIQKHAPYADVLVVDDGSRDGSGKIAAESGVAVLRLPFNLGIGGAMQAGYLYAQRHHYDGAVQFDGDGQHLASEIECLLNPILAGHFDIVVGSRFLNQGSYRAPVLRRSGIWLFSLLLTRILGTKVTDTTSGFRAMNRTTIEFFSRRYPDDYPEVEALVLAHKVNLRIAEVPVKMQHRTGGQSSITPLRSVYYMVKVSLAVLIDLIKAAR